MTYEFKKQKKYSRYKSFLNFLRQYQYGDYIQTIAQAFRKKEILSVLNKKSLFYIENK
ncbi:hypothetical protein [Chryseobacterium contaminans]|uniref:hypothetical protein n=1 Tax=Chryseobacterium contaminans TaxID=1423959 RepID=UPI00301B258C